MAVNIDSKSVFKKLGISGSYEEALANDITVDTVLAGITLTNKHQFKNYIPFGEGVIGMLMKDTLGQYSKSHLSHLVKVAVDKLVTQTVEQADPGGKTSEWPNWSDEIETKGTVTVDGKKVGDVTNVSIKVGDPDVLAGDDAVVLNALDTFVANKKKKPKGVPLKKTATKKGPNLDAPSVSLKKANYLYQPVTGTSDHSRYFLIAKAKNVRVAARIKGHKLSLRVESPNLEKYTAQLSGAGLDLMGTHASIHLGVGNLKMAKRTVGALLLDMGFDWDTKMPDIKQIYGKGV